jgi:hypothetical protein
MIKLKVSNMNASNVEVDEGDTLALNIGGTTRGN